MSKHISIVDRLLSGDEYDISKIDDEIGRWHRSATSLSLHDWLGFSREEYEIFVEQPNLVRVILAARRQGVSPDVLLKVPEKKLAARGISREEVEQLHKWLTATGRL